MHNFGIQEARESFLRHISIQNIEYTYKNVKQITNKIRARSDILNSKRQRINKTHVK